MNRALLQELVAIAAQLASIAARLAEADASPDDMLTEREAIAIAKCSIRTLRDARRNGQLDMYGAQRSRTVRRSELMAWIESRRVRPVAGIDDADMRRRLKRLGMKYTGDPAARKQRRGKSALL